LLSQSLLASFQFEVQWEGLQLVNAGKAGGGITSMTGYATREGSAPGYSWTWEVRGVNARGLDIRLRLPDGLGALEAELRKKIGAVAARGSVNVTLRLSRAEDPGAAGVDPAGRVAQELALIAVKSDVTEEIDRLRAHVAAGPRLLAETGGRSAASSTS
jgi:uncharacterized protein YicC (UPF0701 family)